MCRLGNDTSPHPVCRLEQVISVVLCISASTLLATSVQLHSPRVYNYCFFSFCMLGSDRLIYRLEFKPKILLLQFTVNMVYELVLVRFITATALVLLVPKVEGEEQECKRFLPLNGANSHSADCSILEVHCSLMTNCGTPGSVCEQEIPWPPEK